MSAFAAGLAVLFADPNMAVDAIYTQAGAPAGVPVRIILSRPDEVADYGMSRVVTATAVGEVMAAQVAAPAAGDTVTVGGRTLTVNAAPQRDELGLTWRLELV